MISESKPKANKKVKKTAAERKLPEGFAPEAIILYPCTTEKAVRLTAANVITFIVARSATKNTIKKAAEALYGVKVKSVKTENAFDGRKKAYIALSPETSASDLATKLGML